MAVKREFTCLAHGAFEATEAKCPYGCTAAVSREFRTAPAGHSSKTKATDAALERLAMRFGMTDISNRNGTVAASKKGPGGLDFSPIWKEVPKGDTLEIGRGIVAREGGSGGAEAASREYGTGRMSDEPFATHDVPLPLGVMPPKPRPNVVGRDTVTSADFSQALSRAQ